MVVAIWLLSSIRSSIHIFTVIVMAGSSSDGRMAAVVEASMVAIAADLADSAVEAMLEAQAEDRAAVEREERRRAMEVGSSEEVEVLRCQLARAEEEERAAVQRRRQAAARLAMAEEQWKERRKERREVRRQDRREERREARQRKRARLVEEEAKGKGLCLCLCMLATALILPLIPPCAHANRSALPLCLGNHARAGESNNAKAYVLAIILEWEHSHII